VPLRSAFVCLDLHFAGKRNKNNEKPVYTRRTITLQLFCRIAISNYFVALATNQTRPSVENLGSRDEQPVNNRSKAPGILDKPYFRFSTYQSEDFSTEQRAEPFFRFFSRFTVRFLPQVHTTSIPFRKQSCHFLSALPLALHHSCITSGPAYFNLPCLLRPSEEGIIDIKMSLQSTYEKFLATANPSLLAEDAALHYVTTLTSLHGAAEIDKHLKSQGRDLKKKEEKILDVVEAANALVVEVHTTLEFLTGGGAYLPSLDDNFLADHVATFPIVSFVFPLFLRRAVADYRSHRSILSASTQMEKSRKYVRIGIKDRFSN
jgi:hypothetical protein